MESFKVADRALQHLKSDEPGVVVINFSASAIAAETGSLERTVEAIQYVDTCLGGIVERVRSAGGVSIVTASHGSCEEMLTARGEPNRFATRGDVPLHIVDDELSMIQLRAGGSLSDVAPTVLGILGIEKPSDMTGDDLRVAS